MKDKELKPCPLCGGEAVASYTTIDKENKFTYGWIGCQKCRLFINYKNNLRGVEKAIKTWNRRAKEG